MVEHELWIAFAEDDLKAANILFKSEEVLLNAVLFHSQQCAEKALKAYLVCNAIPFKKTHDLAYLVNCCSTFDLTFDTLLANATNLTPYATESRYPDSQCFITDTITAENMMLEAAEVLEFVKLRLQE